MGRRAGRLLGLTVLVALVGGACGGGGDDDERSGEATSTDTPAPTTPRPAPNTTPDGADDPAGRQRNRRVEILLVGADL